MEVLTAILVVVLQLPRQIRMVMGLTLWVGVFMLWNGKPSCHNSSTRLLTMSLKDFRLHPCLVLPTYLHPIRYLERKSQPNDMGNTTSELPGEL